MVAIDRIQLESLQGLFKLCESVYNSLSKEEQNAIQWMHEELYSIPHCIRRWLQACNELLDDY